jgi:uncharacterized membrane protein
MVLKETWKERREKVAEARPSRSRQNILAINQPLLDQVDILLHNRQPTKETKEREKMSGRGFGGRSPGGRGGRGRGSPGGRGGRGGGGRYVSDFIIDVLF